MPISVCTNGLQSVTRSIDVVIPAFNAERYLERAIESVLALGRDALRVLIVDDGSSDQTSRIAQRFADRWPAQCRLLRCSENRGVSAARNIGIQAATAQFIAFLDADDVYLPNRFASFDALDDEALQRIDGIYQSARIVPEGERDLDGGTGDGTTFGIVRPLFGPALLAELLTGYCWATSAIVIRRSVFAQCGVFDPARKIAEDCHLWFRLATFAALRAGAMDEPVSVYWRHAENTFVPRIEHRLPMLDAMLDAWRYAATNRAPVAMLRTYAEAVPRYALRSVIAAREANAPVVARQLLMRLARSRPRTAIGAEFLRQAWALARAA